MKVAAVLFPLALACSSIPPTDITIDDTAAVAEVDERFLSFAVDTAQVVGSKFWDPDGTVGVVGQLDIDPYDFSRPRLRRMARELAPAILRIGGSDADMVYYDLGETPSSTLPEGFEYAFTREQLDGVADFAGDLGLDIFFTLNAGPGPRDAGRVWRDDNSRELISYAVARDMPVVVWELGNEINAYPLLHNLNLSGAAFAADAAAARAMIDELDPGTPLAAPSVAFWPELGEIIDVLGPFLEAGGGDHLDLITWHYYPQQSIRCPVRSRAAEPGVLLQPENLDELAIWREHVEGLRDQHAPDLPVWLGESGNAQCGGQPGISDAFEGGFWWLDQLGQLARAGQRIVVRQTLSGSNYGLISDETLEPNPDYFLSLLWRRLMGQRVLAASSSDPLVRVYAHCTDTARGEYPGGAVTALLINLDGEGARAFELDGPVDLYLVTADSVGATAIELNGERLAVAADGAPPELAPVQREGRIEMPPRSIAFAVLPEAGSAACR